MEHQNIKQAFIDSAVRVVARDGMEKATTKAIAAEAKLNEAYIYKCFPSKDELPQRGTSHGGCELCQLSAKDASYHAYAGVLLERAGVYPLEKDLGVCLA